MGTRMGLRLLSQVDLVYLKCLHFNYGKILAYTMYKLNRSFPECLQLQMSEACLRNGITEKRKSKKGIGAGAIIGIIVILVLVIGIAAWCVYAYKHPTSKSGLFFIEVRFFSIILVRRFIYCTTEKNWSTDISSLEI